MVGVFFVQHLPGNGLLVGHRPPHVRQTDARWEIGESLLHYLRELNAEQLLAGFVEHLLKRNVLKRYQSGLEQVKPSLVGEGEHRRSLERAAEYSIRMVPQKFQKNLSSMRLSSQ